MQETIGEYLASGAIRSLTPSEIKRTKFWIPIFTRPKKDSAKLRLITDLRILNLCHQNPHHKAENWKNVVETISDPRWSWALTLDLKSFFHHLQMGGKMQRWMRFKIGAQGYQICAMPFGWSQAPYWAHRLARPIRSWLNRQGWAHCWWVDDVLLLGSSPQEVTDRACQLVDQLTKLGIRVNVEKSMQVPAQTVTYVGHQINFLTSTLHPVPQRLPQSLKVLKEAGRGAKILPRHLARVGGHLLDCVKSNVALHGLPQQVMQHAGRAVHKNAQIFGVWDRHRCWSTPVQKSHKIRSLLLDCQKAIQNPIPRPFRPQKDSVYTLRTDASDRGWGATLLQGGQEILSAAQEWTPQELMAHITYREALASAKGAECALTRLPPGCTLKIQSDATSTVFSWLKGSKIPGMNVHIAQQCMEFARRGIVIQPTHIPGLRNRRADWLSRNPDPKSYSLNRQLFLWVCRKLRAYPEVDLFSNRKNRQCKKFCSWRTDPESLGNAFSIPWGRHFSWINPPWELLPRTLKKLREDRAEGLLCCPIWEAAPWWRTLQELRTGPGIIVRNQAIFKGPDGKSLPPPRWATLFTRVSGSQP